VASRAFICGLNGLTLSDEEQSFLREFQPWGLILFKRNIGDASSVRRLCAAAREALGRNAPILIDQEGGRVQRIGPPIARAYPPGSAYGALYARDPQRGVEAARSGARLLAQDLLEMGIDVDCLPVLDLPAEGLTPAIGDRALGHTVDSLVALGRAQVEGLLSGGVLPVMKHVPGHGRARVDSHKELPRAGGTLAELDETDFAPFRTLAQAVPLAMTAHVVFEEIDDNAPATLSATIIDKIIRGRIGFDGLLMTDDISMGALSGSLSSRAERAIRAGCDLVLHCTGELDEALEIAGAVPWLEGNALRRAEAALGWRRRPEPIDRATLEARFNNLLSSSAAA
jgi:beta-N-acetylhexosaminidase